ncbi:ribosome-associated translation inhibitor RaiA [Desulfobotulus sp. H1]|uniref:Ribosome hibernation promoting factor n=1 Tax=Desulfobotulus pelophilus TaxID=2823377 RepID=A0ABT3N5T6_9BACT|nr:ribosome-associated translation inhibitor RaiA [Desulfobotulus pelophilus]MCW7752823.1 ribosome-associated translation inhibitor RaiA [Desulfobotulus pelophilus]
MKTAVTFKNIEPSEALKDYAASKLARLDKQFDSPAEAQVVLSVEKIRHIAEVRITCDRLNLQATEETENMYAALDLVVDKLKKQIRRSKEKKREKRPVSKGGIKGAEASMAEAAAIRQSEEEEPAAPSSPPGLVVESMYFKPMDAEEAAMQLAISDKDFIVYTDAQTNQVNVLYLRKDGDMGLIQPTA